MPDKKILNYKLSQHALYRIKERKLSFTRIKDVLRDGISTGENVFVLNNYYVVVKGVTIITCWCGGYRQKEQKMEIAPPRKYELVQLKNKYN